MCSSKLQSGNCYTHKVIMFFCRYACQLQPMSVLYLWLRPVHHLHWRKRSRHSVSCAIKYSMKDPPSTSQCPSNTVSKNSFVCLITFP